MSAQKPSSSKSTPRKPASKMTMYVDLRYLVLSIVFCFCTNSFLVSALERTQCRLLCPSSKSAHHPRPSGMTMHLRLKTSELSFAVFLYFQYITTWHCFSESNILDKSFEATFKRNSKRYVTYADISFIVKSAIVRP